MVDRAFAIAIRQVEKQRFAATDRPRTSTPVGDPASRHIPDEVQRAVWIRDGGACTYLSEDGRRCGSTFQVQFHHQIEFALGGEPTKENVCLMCRPHNQYLAECTYGPGFMEAKRLAAAEARAAAARDRAEATTPDDPDRRDVVSALRNLGYRAREAEDAAAVCTTMPGATLEQKVRAALQFFRRGKRVGAPFPPATRAADVPPAVDGVAM